MEINTVVCNACGSAACWEGNLMCEDSYEAGTAAVTRACVAGGDHRCRVPFCGCPHHTGGDHW